MSKYDKLRKEKDEAVRSIKFETEILHRVAEESNRVANVAKNADLIISNLDKQFESVTKLDSVDVKFLFFATALQCIRQYALTDFERRVSDKEGAKNTFGHTEEHSDRFHKWYNPTLEEIITNPVPFDTNFGGKNFDLGIGGGFTHRAKTLGHDPLLGWIFGTANIATSTMTTWDMQSFHIKTDYTSRGDARDKITNRANTGKVLYYTKEKLFNSGPEGKQIVGTSLIKEAIHLKSDINTYAGLPLPIISTISPDFAKQLADYGLDMGNVLNVSKQAAYAVLINTIISMIHYLFFDKTKNSPSTYEIKTRKILSYSNLIASSSNVIFVAANAVMGNEQALQKFDVGGLIVTLYRLITDSKFIQKIKQEFLEETWNKKVLGNEF